MRANSFKLIQHTACAALTAFLLGSGASFASSVALTAGPASATMPDGQSIPMWGYSCGAVTGVGTSCTAANGSPQSGSGVWQPPLITVPSNETLTIKLKNKLTFGANNIPTSLVIVGQLGGGLGTPTKRLSPVHAPQGPTWPIAAPAGGDATFQPPAQAKRVQSFATEVAAGSTNSTLTWSDLKPGTYLIESGTHPSIQGPMGLYGVLVVTDPAVPKTAYGVAYDKDVTLLLSEIDAVQNAAVDAAVRTAGFSETKVWSGQPGGCGNPASPVYRTCYPPAVNYDPRYYLINGKSFDRNNPDATSLAVPAAETSGNVLLRFVNAGLRMHIPSVVGKSMTLLAQDGFKLPGTFKVQSEMFLAAGKTGDVTIQPDLGTGGYAAATYPVFDRQLSLSTNNQRDGGMQVYVKVAGGAAPPAAPTAAAVADTYSLVPGNTLTVSSAATGVMANDVGVYGVTVLSPPPAADGTLTLNPNGAFTFVPNSGITATSFTYCANGTVSGAACSSGLSATVTLAPCTGSCLGGKPVANADAYTSKVATLLKISPPGVLANDSDPDGHPLTAQLVGSATGGTVSLNADGSFSVLPTSPPTGWGATATVSFQYNAVNSQHNVSAAPATVSVTFKGGSGLHVTLKDGPTGTTMPADYRWIIEEDRSFLISPNASQTNTVGAPPVPALGTNFHTSHMPVVAQGCVGTASCEAGQTLLGTPAVCDQGNGICRTDASQKTAIDPGQVALDPTKRYYLSILPGDAANGFIAGAGGDPATDCGTYGTTAAKWAVGTGTCGHALGGAPIAPGQTSVNVLLTQTPLPTAKITVFVFEDDQPLNGENDAGGGIDVLAPNEPGLGGFQITLFDQAGQLGDPTGQISYDMFNMPVSNALAGTIDPATGFDACPISKKASADPSQQGVAGMIVTCPKYEGRADGTTTKVLSPFAGQAVIANMYPGLYEVVATPAAERIAKGEEWLQTNTLDGTKPHEAFIKPGEPAYFQEFGPAGFHVSIGFANPKIINARKAAVCATQSCLNSVTGVVTTTRLSRTPDQRLYSSGNNAANSFTQCYVSLGDPDEEDFAFTKCDANGKFSFTGLPDGNWRITIFDQWNDLLVDGLSTPVALGPSNRNLNLGEVSMQHWRTNVYTRTYFDQNGNGVSDEGEPGLPLVATNIRYRDGSIGFFNSTDLDGYAGFNEIFPFFNWLVLEADSTRYKQTGVHVVYDAGGPADGTPGGGTSTIVDHLANSKEAFHLPTALRFPGSVYCATADCTSDNRLTHPTGGGTDGSTGRIDPPWVTTEAWQGNLGQAEFVEFGKAPYAAGENGGIRGEVNYASTRPFDDPALLLQLSWAPNIPNVTVNLYQKTTAADGTESLKLVDHTLTSSWDDWAQGVRSDGKPNMNCPGQDPTSPFFYTLQNSQQFLNPGALPNNSQFKCYDGWAMQNQVQPAPYDGMYKFPSVVARNSTTGAPTATNCTVCGADPAAAQLPPGKYVVEVIVPPGYELVKEEDKNILIGDNYIAPVTQQFAGLGSVFILPDQAAVNAAYNANNPQNPTTNLGSTPRNEGDTGSIETFWPCVGAKRIVPDWLSEFPAAAEVAPFAGASRNLCDRKEVALHDQMGVLAKFYLFSGPHIAAHFSGMVNDDFASEFDPFSPQYGEKFAPPNLPIAIKDWSGNEISRVYSDQWGGYNGVTYSSWSPNPPNPTGYAPAVMVMCMNDPGTGATPDPLYNPSYSNFCYEWSFMPGQTSYLDTPVVPTAAFAEGYNPADCAYPDTTPAIKDVNGDGVGPWVGTGPGTIASVTLSSSGSAYTSPPNVSIAGGSGSGATVTADLKVVSIASITCSASGTNSCSRYGVHPLVTISGGGGTGATATAQKNGSTISFTVTSGGSAYTSRPTVTVARSGSDSTATAVMAVNAVNLTANGTGYSTPLSVNFSGGGGSGAAASAQMGSSAKTLTINALGDQQVPNHAYSGPQATAVPFNQKFITRHYGFGPRPSTCPTTGACPDVTIGGVPMTNVAWSDSAITGTVPSLSAAQSSCALQQRNQPPTRCGELAITAANGKKTIDTVTVTIGGKAPTVLAGGQSIQSAIDAATPGDLIMVPSGRYTEMLLMWKPVRLQGVGAASSVLNANSHPSGKLLDPWRKKVNCLFGLTADGRPAGSAYDGCAIPSVPDNAMAVDRVPLEGMVGWDTTLNGNLAELLAEPTLMGAYEGAGITIVAKGVRYDCSDPSVTGGCPFGNGDINVGTTAHEGQMPPNTQRLTNSDRDCNDFPGNFLCNPSRIDGLTITNSSQGGGGIFAHGWAHNLEISNNRLYGNTGTLTGGITIGQGEFPDAYVKGNNGDPTGFDQAPWTCMSANEQSTLPDGAQMPYCLNTNANLHNNAITRNSSIGDELYSSTPTAAGGVTITTGSDYYHFNQNWVCGNLSTGDGGGMVHSGFIYNGDISHNWFLFNQSNNPTIPTYGGGLAILRAAPDPLVNGVECGAVNDQDCPPGLADGTGPGLVIDSNLIVGNTAESGSGGGIMLQGVNGSEVGAFPRNPERWNDVTLINNIIANNVAGWDGGGVSMEDSLKVKFINNTVISNDTTASAGVLFNTLGAPLSSSPTPAPNQMADLTHSAPQPAGLATMRNTTNLVASMPATVTCPSGYGYTNNSQCRSISLPLLKNNMIWQNRAFHLSVEGNGPGLQNQQHLVTLLPQLSQTSTGNCPGGASYWDLGIRGDTSPTNHDSGFTLSPGNSILSSLSGGYSGNGNIAPANAGVVSQYCNGSRVPPENGGFGFNVDPGIADATSPNPVFNLTAAATVDEGNNWVNMSYGPLSLSKAGAYTGPNVMLAALGDYSIQSGSAAIDVGSNSGAPNHDFFGKTRPAGNGFDIGAVEFAGAGGGGGNAGSASLTPATWSSSTTRCSGLGCLLKPTQVFTLTNTGSTTLTGITQAALGGVNASSYSIVRLLSTCGPTGNGQLLAHTSLAAGASCAVTVRFQPLTSEPTGVKHATVSVTDSAGTQSSTLTGTAQ